jgi:tetratricopeptide (TPR) repeat protein
MFDAIGSGGAEPCFGHGNGNTLGSRGLVHLKLKELDSALADYDAALKADSKNAFSLYGRGMAKRLKADKAGADADADIAAAEQISPDIAEDFERYDVSARNASIPFQRISDKTGL